MANTNTNSQTTVSNRREASEEMTPEVLENAVRLYTPPFRYEYGFIWDAKDNMVADEAGDGALLRIRGWGRIGYMAKPEELQDAVGELIARALTLFWEFRLKGRKGNDSTD